MDKMIERASVLIEALPYMREFHGTTIVIKYGGAAMVREELKKCVIEDIVLLGYVGIRPVIVHGGGSEISELMKRLGIEPKFVAGQRITDKDTLEVVEMVLTGRINGEIVNLINQTGGKAVGLSGKDGGLIKAEKIECGAEVDADLGFVGKVKSLNVSVLEILDNAGYIPVISPIGVDCQGQTLNINADFVAAHIASELKAEKLIILTDVSGVLERPDDETTLISTIKTSEIPELIEKKVLAGGMIPKLKACMEAVKGNTKKAHIIDGRIPHSLLLELFTDKGIGTQIVSD
ncbi:acetylglutamate kinase [Candidatus Sumerlaeota bacterium]|nr:acetylglutamate kinase [Candidatus Sumerlaeota bacterium]